MFIGKEEERAVIATHTKTEEKRTITSSTIDIENYAAAISARTIDYHSNCNDQGIIERNDNNDNRNNFLCHNIDLLIHIPFNELKLDNGRSPREGSDVWGWTYYNTNDATVMPREFVIWCVDDEGYLFIEITNPIKPILIGNINAGRTSTKKLILLRDVKVMGNFAYMIGDYTKLGLINKIDEGYV